MIVIILELIVSVVYGRASEIEIDRTGERERIIDRENVGL